VGAVTVSQYESTGWPAVDDDEIVAGLHEAIEDGRRDQLDGGIHSSVLVDYVDNIGDKAHVHHRLEDLVDEGRVRRVRGVPQDAGNPRTSHLPVGFKDGDDDA
jgi:hypothetical protein